MGTGRSVPAWVVEIQLMREFGWTEKQLLEEVSSLTVARAQVLLELEERAAKVKEKRWS